MSVASQPSSFPKPECWCCGAEFDERDLVRLGAHPEVGICLDCARYLQRRASQRRGELHSPPTAKVTAGIATIRGWVVKHGWHDRPLIGPLLRRIDRLLP